MKRFRIKTVWLRHITTFVICLQPTVFKVWTNSFSMFCGKRLRLGGSATRFVICGCFTFACVVRHLHQQSSTTSLFLLFIRQFKAMVLGTFLISILVRFEIIPTAPIATKRYKDYIQNGSVKFTTTSLNSSMFNLFRMIRISERQSFLTAFNTARKFTGTTETEMTVIYIYRNIGKPR